METTLNKKTYGTISIDGTIYTFVGGNSGSSFVSESRLFKSADHLQSFMNAGVRYAEADGLAIFFFCQMGQDYAAVIDDYVYIFATELKDPDTGEVQQPGEHSLARVLESEIENQGAYE